jgi:hypothetical protein
MRHILRQSSERKLLFCTMAPQTQIRHSTRSTLAASADCAGACVLVWALTPSGVSKVRTEQFRCSGV